MKKTCMRALSAFLAVIMSVVSLPIGVIINALTEENVSGEDRTETNAASGDTVPDSDGYTPQSWQEHTLEYVVWDGSAADGLSGDGSKESPYLITSGAELKYFADQVNSGNSYAGKYIRLEVNIDMNHRVWTPVGYSASNPFSGSFDGGMHEIKDFYLLFGGKTLGANVDRYVGFFGYMKNATVSNLGIKDQRVVESYNFDSYIGAFAAYLDSSTVTNCYVDGEQNVSFTAQSPESFDFNKVRNLHTVYASTSDGKYVIPAPSIPSGSEEHAIIYDFTGQTNWSVSSGVTITIPKNVSAVKFRGISGKLLNGINIKIEDGSTYNCLIDFEDFWIESGSITYSGSGRDVYIRSSGVSNVIHNPNGSTVNIPNTDVAIITNAPITFSCGQAEKGADNNSVASMGNQGVIGGTGNTGFTTFISKTLYVCGSSTVEIIGGKGGEGGRGGQGGQGDHGTDRNWVWEGGAGRGQNGAQGGQGGYGGRGGAPVFNETKISVESGTLTLVGGSGGTGGQGGKGGTGGRGGNNTAWGGSTGNGGSGGTGGTGGTGGDYYTGFATYMMAVSSYGSIVIRNGSNGNGGTGGQGGDPGAGGTANSMCGGGGVRGAYGTTGSVGASGTATAAAPTVTGGDVSIFSMGKLSSATLTLGGFVGFVDASSSVSKCVSIMPNVKSPTDAVHIGYSYNKYTSGNFAAVCNGSATDCLAVYRSQDTYQKHDISTWFGDSNSHAGAEVSVSILYSYSDGVKEYTYTDSQGLYFDADIASDNKVAVGRRLVGMRKMGVRASIIIPDYVFSGRFIAEINAIGDLAFENSEDIAQVTAGSFVRTVGDYAFYNSSIESFEVDKENSKIESIGECAFAKCTSLQKAVIPDKVTLVGKDLFSGCTTLSEIYIGASLTDIPEYPQSNSASGGDTDAEELSSYIFGLDKEKRNPKMKYIVSESNARFSSDDWGVLYETMLIGFKDGAESVEVAVIDAPMSVSYAGYTIPVHVVKIAPYAFAYNTTLESVALDYVMTVSSHAFFDAKALKSVHFGTPEESDEDEYITILEEKVKRGEIKNSYIIDTMAFAKCTSLQSVNLDSPFIIKIGESAFADCGSSMNVVKLGAGIQVIEQNAFGSRGSGVNATRTKWFEVTADQNGEENKHYKSIDGVLYRYLEDKTLSLVFYPIMKTTEMGGSVYATEFSVPCIDDDGDPVSVTQIEADSFSYSTELKYVTVEGVSIIGSGAFSKTNIHRIYIGDSVKELGGKVDDSSHEMFADCGYLSEITVGEGNTNYTSVDGVLFNKDKSVLLKYPANKDGKKYSVPECVSEIREYAFENNLILRSVVINSDILSVGMNAFSGCSKLSVIYFKNAKAPVAVGANAFATYDKTNIEIADPRTTIYYSKGYAELWEGFMKAHSGYRFAEYNVSAPSNQQFNNYYAIVVVDKAGFPINNINIELTDPNGFMLGKATADDGIATFVDQYDEHGVGFDIDYTKAYQLRVVDNIGGYFPTENAEFYLDESTRITYITLSGVPSASGVSVSYDNNAGDAISKDDVVLGSFGSLVEIIGGSHRVIDINSQSASINKWCIDHIDIIVGCGYDADSTLLGFQLVQGGEIIKLSSLQESSAEISLHGAKKFAKITISVETKLLYDDKPIYAIIDVQNSAGEVETVKTKLNINVFTMDFYPLNMSWATNEMKLTVDKNIPILGGSELKLTVPEKYQLFANIGIGSDYFRIILNDDKLNRDVLLGDNYKYENGVLDAEKMGSWESYVDLKDREKTEKEFSKANKLGFSLGGYVEIKYKADAPEGESKYEVTGSITGKLKFTYSEGTTVQVWIIPVRVDVSISVSGELTFTVKFDPDTLQFEVPENLDFVFTGGVEAYAGIGCKLASAGVYGSIATVIVADIYPRKLDEFFKLEKWTFKGDMGLYVKVDGLFVKFKQTWSLFEMLGIENEWIIYENGKWWYEGESIEVCELPQYNSALLYDESNYEIAQSTVPLYLSSQDVLDIAEDPQSADDYGSIAPKTLRVGDKIYVFYHLDMNAIDGYKDGYDSYNYQKIVYQIYDVSSGELADELYVLDDNGFADAAFDVYYDGEDAVIVYSQLKQKLTSEDIDDMSAFVGAIELKSAVLSERGTFEVCDAPLTSNDSYDMHIRLAELDGNIVCVWVKNDENSMFGETDNNNMSIMYSVFDGSTWSEASAVRTGLGTITDITVGEGVIAYVTDTNNHVATVGAEREVEGASDRLIHVIDYAGEVQYHTDSESTYHGIKYMGSTLVYYSENNLYEYTPESTVAVFDTKVEELTERYTVLTDDNGEIAGILYVAGEYDENAEALGSDIYAVFCRGGVWGEPVAITDYSEGVYVTSFDAVHLGSEMLLSVLLTEIEFTDDPTEEGNYISHNTHLTYKLAYPTGYSMENVKVAYGSESEDGTVADILIKNNGYLTLEEADVTISLGDEVITSQTVCTFYDDGGNIVSGGLASGESAWVKVEFAPGEPTDQDYTVSVCGKELDVRVWYSDVAVFGKEVLIGDTFYIVAYVTNKNSLAVPYRITASAGERVFFEYEQTEPLGMGEIEYVNIPLTDDVRELVCVSVESGEEYILTNNKAKISVATESEVDVETGADSHVRLSKTNIIVDISDPTDVDIMFDPSFELQYISYQGTVYRDMLFTRKNDETITISADIVSEWFDYGTYALELVFTDSEGEIKTAVVNLTVTQILELVWIVDGVEFEESCVAGEIPKSPAASKSPDAQYTYTFAGWECSVEDAVDETGAVWQNCSFVAVFDKTLNSYTVSWENTGYGSVQESYDYGDIPEYKGETPKKSSTAEYEYVFIGWDREVGSVEGDIVYTACFEQVIRKYTVTYVIDGTEYTQELGYGLVPSPAPAQKASDDRYDYVFTGWTPQLSAVYSDQSYTAAFTAVPRVYTVCFVVDGEVYELEYHFGDMPSFDLVPEKQSDAKYSYTFIGWDKEICQVTENTVYTALFEAELNKYTVTFAVGDEKYEYSYEYGTVPSFEENTAKAPDDTYKYVFTGWDKAVSAVSCDVTYTALYDAVVRGHAKAVNSSFVSARGASFTTTITLSEISGMSSAAIKVYYNTDVVTLIGAQAGEGVRVTGQGIGYVALDVDFGVDPTSIEIVRLEFEISGDAPVGNTEFLQLAGEDIYACEWQGVSVISGDVDCDGALTNSDVALLVRYMSGWQTEMDLELADKDQNGRINNRDAISLIQTMAGW